MEDKEKIKLLIDAIINNASIIHGDRVNVVRVPYQEVKKILKAMDLNEVDYYQVDNILSNFINEYIDIFSLYGINVNKQSFYPTYKRAPVRWQMSNGNYI